MRTLLLNRIDEISKGENDFSKSLMRWRNVLIKDVHISKVVFVELTDEELLEAFERIVRQVYKQM